MERTRALAKVVDFTRLHNEFRAQSVPFKGLAGDSTPGGTLRLIDPDDLSDAQIDVLIAAHVPPTTDQANMAVAVASIDDAKLKAVTRALLDVIDARHPANPIDRAAFRAQAIAYLKALL